MEECERRIDALADWRDSYFLENPDGSLQDRDIELRKRVAVIIEDLPFGDDLGPGRRDLAAGRAYNLADGYDVRAENCLEKVVKAHPESAAAWFELGECVWKKDDIDAAIGCFEESVSRSRTCRALASLSVALRELAVRTKDPRERSQFLESGMKLAIEATKAPDANGYAQFVVGNACFNSFLIGAMQQRSLLEAALSAYRTALDCPSQRYNMELMLNYATSLRLDFQLPLSLQYHERAAKLEPRRADVTEVAQQASLYRDRLLSEWKKRGSGMSRKKCTDAVAKMDSHSMTKPFGETTTSAAQQPNSSNTSWCGIVTGIVANPLEVPLTVIAVDSSDSPVVLAVSNVSRNFSFIVGDRVAVYRPRLSRLPLQEQDDGVDQIPLIHVVDPRSCISRNGQSLSPVQIASVLAATSAQTAARRQT